jgi:HNH endonuclease
LGLDDQPGHLTGYGPITADTARRLAAEESGTWRRLLTDPDTGALLDISAHRYRPPQRLRDYLAARDDTCAFPTCHQPAHRCQPDHTIPFHQAGPTRRDNLALTCPRHNRAKTTGTGWTYQHNPDGTFTWTTPTGHRYTGAATRPEDDPPPF